MTASSLPEDYPYVYRAAYIALIDLTVGERVGPLCVLTSTGGIPVYVGAVIYRWPPYVVRPKRGLAAYLAAGAVPKAYCQFLP